MADTPMRPETTSEHIARDMREGRFPEQSERQMVPVKADLPAEIMVWKSNPGLDHLGTWATERYPEEAVAYVPLETCNARVDAMVEAAAADCDRMAGEIADAVLTGLPEQARIREGMESAFTKAAARIRTLVTADHTAALDAMISRARADGMREALNIANMNAWRHQGEDAHSKGMDAGARHQSQVIHDAITAALAEPPAAIRANAGEG